MKNDFNYKWSKLFASKRYNTKDGVIELTPEEQQELLDDSERVVKNCSIHSVSDTCSLLEEILTPEQIQNALSWYDKHRNHVNSLVNGVSKFPPTLNEDKRDCRLWKPEHWNWFLAHYH